MAEKRQLLSVINEDHHENNILDAVSISVASSFGSGLRPTGDTRVDWESDVRTTKSKSNQEYQNLDSDQTELDYYTIFSLLLNKILTGAFGAFSYGAVIYGFFGVYLNLAGNAYNSITAILATVRAFRIAAAIFSDVIPICGRRRTPYILIGWSICTLFLLAPIALEYPKPYYGWSNCTRNTSLLISP